MAFWNSKKAKEDVLRGKDESESRSASPELPLRPRSEASQRGEPQASPATPELKRGEGKDAKEVITRAAKQQQSAEKKIVETKQVITFELDKEEYAAPILDLREILRTPEIITVPGVPPFVKGIFNLRGQIVVVIDLEKRFALEREHPVEPRDVIIVEVGGTIFGVVVDEVTGVLRVPITSIKPTPPLVASKIHADYLNGVIVLGESEGTKAASAEASAGREKEEVAPASPKLQQGEPEQIEERLKTPSTPLRAGQKQAPGEAKQARILLLLDLPKMLSDEELLSFSTAVRQTVEGVI